MDETLHLIDSKGSLLTPETDSYEWEKSIDMSIEDSTPISGPSDGSVDKFVLSPCDSGLINKTELSAFFDQCLSNVKTENSPVRQPSEMHSISTSANHTPSSDVDLVTFTSFNFHDFDMNYMLNSTEPSIIHNKLSNPVYCLGGAVNSHSTACCDPLLGSSVTGDYFDQEMNFEMNRSADSHLTFGDSSSEIKLESSLPYENSSFIASDGHRSHHSGVCLQTLMDSPPVLPPHQETTPNSYSVDTNLPISKPISLDLKKSLTSPFSQKQEMTPYLTAYGNSRNVKCVGVNGRTSDLQNGGLSALASSITASGGGGGGPRSAARHQTNYFPIFESQSAGSLDNSSVVSAGAGSKVSLTEEEKRMLRLEGFPESALSPQNKQDEKYLRLIRRKVKNKLSAQESRRRKKEYVENLERLVTHLSGENENLRRYVSRLEQSSKSGVGGSNGSVVEPLSVNAGKPCSPLNVPPVRKPDFSATSNLASTTALPSSTGHLFTSSNPVRINNALGNTRFRGSASSTNSMDSSWRSSTPQMSNNLGSLFLNQNERRNHTRAPSPLTVTSRNCSLFSKQCNSTPAPSSLFSSNLKNGYFMVLLLSFSLFLLPPTWMPHGNSPAAHHHIRTAPAPNKHYYSPAAAAWSANSNNKMLAVTPLANIVTASHGKTKKLEKLPGNEPLFGLGYNLDLRPERWLCNVLCSPTSASSESPQTNKPIQAPSTFRESRIFEDPEEFVETNPSSNNNVRNTSKPMTFPDLYFLSPGILQWRNWLSMKEANNQSFHHAVPSSSRPLLTNSSQPWTYSGNRMEMTL